MNFYNNFNVCLTLVMTSSATPLQLYALWLTLLITLCLASGWGRRTRGMAAAEAAAEVGAGVAVPSLPRHWEDDARPRITTPASSEATRPRPLLLRQVSWDGRIGFNISDEVQQLLNFTCSTYVIFLSYTKTKCAEEHSEPRIEGQSELCLTSR